MKHDSGTILPPVLASIPPEVGLRLKNLQKGEETESRTALRSTFVPVALHILSDVVEISTLRSFNVC